MTRRSIDFAFGQAAQARTFDEGRMHQARAPKPQSVIEAYERIPLQPHRRPAPTPIVTAISSPATDEPDQDRYQRLAKAVRKRSSRKTWARLAELYEKHPLMSLPWYAKRTGITHTSVLYALRRMGIYDPVARAEIRSRELERHRLLLRQQKAERRAQWKRERAERLRLLAERDQDKITRKRTQEENRQRAAHIKALLLDGFTQSQVSRMVGVSRIYVWNIEHGLRHKRVQPMRRAA